MSGHADAPHKEASRGGWLSRRTMLGQVAGNVLDAPASGLDAWARTTAGVVALLLALQIVSGVLLAFYYVPSAESAHATIVYTEKVLDGGSWIRALHFYGSQWLPLALLLHLAQMLWSGAHRRKPVGWLAVVVLLALVLVNGATGYSLPWDARAYFSTSVAAGIAGGLPLLGIPLRAWLTGGAELSTLTLSRFYALHVLVVPALILSVVVARFFVLREPIAPPHPEEGERPARTTQPEAGERPAWAWLPAQLARHALVVAVVFVALSLCAAKFPAPLGPPADAADAGYLPRPGAQFLWLFQLLKFFPATMASLVAFLLPAIILGTLAALPFLRRTGGIEAHASRRPGVFGLALIALTLTLVATLSAVASWGDASNARVREQLARQPREEAEFRAVPYVPRRIGDVSSKTSEQAAPNAPGDASAPAENSAAPPPAYVQNCAKCHGQRGEGRSINPQLVGVSNQPRRTPDDLVAIMNNPRRYGLEPRMPSFANKISDTDKRTIAAWLATLK